MDVETKIDLVTRLPTEEILTIADLRDLFERKAHPNHYIGYEISGKLHIGSLIISGMKINDLAKAGVKVQVLLSDWTSYINNKLEGDWEKINTAAKYYDEAFKFFCPKVKTVLASDLTHNNDEYWMNVVTFSKHVTLPRVLRCMTILGRSEKEKLSLSQLLYPSLQSVDIKAIGADIAHAGMDQRKAHVLAREIYPKMGWRKPVAVHHHIILGLTEPVKTKWTKERQDIFLTSKMSKSKPWTCIFIHDTEKQINEKLEKAWCPPKVTEGNPVLELAKYVVFHEFKDLYVERSMKFGGSIVFDSYEELEKEYAKGQLHAADLKPAIASALNKIIKPVREHFEKPRNAKLLNVFKEVEITR